ncbi:hypothetical protein EJB05_57243 [Eragrostis curvula]|uniref:ATPase AAA-type core domain-containing protein n=1 Tax=Eragrostis curvula TaxID=38414 RepID=A0A5J9SFC3_9POAL|nr:hypothetical protein EJB05_57243 [Eragrostis curvula]
MQPARLTMQQPGQSPFTMAAERDGHEEKLMLCTECSKNYEREASLVKAEADAEGPRSSLPAWLVPDRQPADEAHHHKDKYLLELKRKWSRLCRKLHLCSSPPQCPWWSGSCMPPSRPSIAGFLGLEGLMAHGKNRTTEWSPPRRVLTSLREPVCHQDVGTALALGSLPLSDTATSDGRASPGSDGGDGSSAMAARELEQRLRRNVPWQPAAVAAEIAEAVVAGGGRGSGDNKGNRGVWLYVKGSDHAAVRRAAAVIAEARCGSADRVVLVSAEEFRADVVSRAAEVGGGGKVVLVVGDVERAPEDVVDRLVAASRSGVLKGQSGRELDLSDCVVILTTSKFTDVATDDVISLRLWSEEDEASSGDLKRKPDTEPSPTESKRPRHDAGRRLDLNIDLCDDDDEEDEAIPSDITHEGSDDEVEHQPHSLLESLASRVVTLDNAGCPRGHLRAMLLRALSQPAARVEDEAVEALAAASGHFLDETLERWAADVLSPAAAMVRNGGKGNAAVVVLGVGRGGVGARQAGFMGSVLPSRVHVD